MAVFYPPKHAERPSELDIWLEDQLRSCSFEDGVAVLNMPPRLIENRQSLTGQGLPNRVNTISHLQARPLTHDPYYIIDSREEPVCQGRLPRQGQEADTSIACYVALLETLESQKTVTGFNNLRTNTSNRQHLQIKQWCFPGWRCGGLQELQRLTPGINSPSLDVAGVDGPSPFVLHTEHSCLYSLVYMHAGAPRFWVVVPPSEQQRLERRLLERYEGGHPACSQFVRHMSVWVPVEALERWGIRYVGIEQRCGELVVIAPGAYQQGWNSGWNVTERVAYADGHSRSRARNYRQCSPQHCRVQPIHVWPTDGAKCREAVGSAEAPQRAMSPRKWTAPEDSPYRPRVAQTIGLDDLLHLEKRLSADEVKHALRLVHNIIVATKEKAAQYLTACQSLEKAAEIVSTSTVHASEERIMTTGLDQARDKHPKPRATALPPAVPTRSSKRLASRSSDVTGARPVRAQGSRRKVPRQRRTAGSAAQKSKAAAVGQVRKGLARQQPSTALTAKLATAGCSHEEGTPVDADADPTRNIGSDGRSCGAENIGRDADDDVSNVVDDAEATRTGDTSNELSAASALYARACAAVIVHLEQWDAQGRVTSDAAQCIMQRQFAAAVHGNDGRIWEARAMAQHLNTADARRSRAVFDRRISLIQLAAWVAARRLAPDMRDFAGRERDSRVLSLLVEQDQQRRSRDTWWRYNVAGKRWTELVENFGIGVLVLPQSMLGTKSLENENVRGYEQGFANLANDEAFKQIASAITVCLRCIYGAVDESEKEVAESFLRDAAVGRRPWDTSATRPSSAQAALAPTTGASQ